MLVAFAASFSTHAFCDVCVCVCGPHDRASYVLSLPRQHSHAASFALFLQQQQHFCCISFSLLPKRNPAKFEQKMTLKVTLVKCVNLKDDDAQGVSDPYVEFEVDNQSQKSTTKQNTLNPVWNETFTFRDVPKRFHDLKVKVMDFDTGRDDKLGFYFYFSSFLLPFFCMPHPPPLGESAFCFLFSRHFCRGGQSGLQRPAARARERDHGEPWPPWHQVPEGDVHFESHVHSVKKHLSCQCEACGCGPFHLMENDQRLCAYVSLL